MGKVILFGASGLGEIAYQYLKQFYEIILYCDNDESKWGKEINGKKIVSTEYLSTLNKDDIQIVITSMYYREIAVQLNNLDIKKSKVFLQEGQGFSFFSYNNESGKREDDKHLKVFDADKYNLAVKDEFIIIPKDKYLLVPKTGYIAIPKNRFLLKKRKDLNFAYNRKQKKLNHNDINSWNNFWETADYVEDYYDELRHENYKEVLMKITAKLNHGNLIDIGCGLGVFLKLIKGKKYSSLNNIYGCDFSKTAIENCQQNIRDISFEVQDIFDLSYGTDFFDNVFCMDVLEHLEYPHKALKELYRITAKKGKIFITIPNGLIDTYVGHINFWSEENFIGFVNRNLHNVQIHSDRINSRNIEGMLFIITKL